MLNVARVRSLCLVVLLAALAASACGKAGPTSPTAPSSPTLPAPSPGTRVISLSGSLAFGAVEVGKTSELALTIGNSGTATLSVTGITCPDGYTPTWTTGTIAPGGSQQVNVRFAPTAARSYDGALTVIGDHTGGANAAPVSGTGTAPPPPTPPAPTPTPSPTAYDDEILSLINGHRASIGKPALQKNQTIWEQAHTHSQNMASKLVPFGHDGFEARIAAIRAVLGPGGSGAENVAMGYTSAASVVNAWLSSPGHRANIEGTSTRTGVSAVRSSEGIWYYTQVFY
jgi:uncharacterized protein YkwD